MISNIDNTTAAPFNMAIATLMRLDEILKESKNLIYLINDLGVRQETKIDLLRSFFLNSVPLLKPEEVDEFSWILELETLKREELIKNAGQNKPSGKLKPFFDKEIELKINKAFVSIQQRLQEGHYFMPPKKDAGRAVLDM